MLIINDDIKLFNSNILFINDNKIDTYSLLRQISGINKSDIKFNNELIYDNKTYFNNRIYLENNIKYLNTLSARQINNQMTSEYNKSINQDLFKKLVNDTRLRLGLKKNTYYQFSDSKLNILNVCLLLSFDQYKIIPYLYEYIDDEYAINAINKELIKQNNIITSSYLKDLSKIDTSNFDLYFIYNNENKLKYTKINKYEDYYQTKEITHKDEFKYIVFKNNDFYILDYKIKEDKQVYPLVKQDITKIRIGK